MSVPTLPLVPQEAVQDAAQAGDPASLARLNDVVLPPEVSLAPTAPGWLLVGLGGLVTLIALGALVVRRRRALRYRREALARLAALRAAGEPRGLPVLLKEVALRVHPRAEVASLSGEAWSAFLDRTGGAGRFGAGAGATLAALAYAPASGAEALDGEPVFAAAEAWLRAQGPEDRGTPAGGGAGR